MSGKYLSVIANGVDVSEIDLQNAGKDCWNGCKKEQGKCDWCGADGWCCRKGWVGNGCDGNIGGGGHQCVLNTEDLGLKLMASESEV